MKVSKKCFVCGSEADTFDHIPPRSMFPKNFQHKGVKVPACKKCNNKTSKDDEYLRDVFSMTGFNKDAHKVFIEKVRPSYTRLYSRLQKVTKHQRILDSMGKIDIKSPNGIFIKQAMGMKMDSKRVNRILAKVVKGLHFNRFKKSIPDDYSIKIYFQPVDIGKDLIDEARRKKALSAEKFGNTFSYMHLTVKEDDFVGVWWLSFYQTHGVIIIVDSPEKLFE